MLCNNFLCTIFFGKVGGKFYFGKLLHEVIWRYGCVKAQFLLKQWCKATKISAYCSKLALVWGYVWWLRLAHQFAWNSFTVMTAQVMLSAFSSVIITVTNTERTFILLRATVLKFVRSFCFLLKNNFFLNLSCYCYVTFVTHVLVVCASFPLKKDVSA